MDAKDLKGISWVGNIYQKFEAMCLEVEEIMYQDTVKYVENQVQTVGSSVKKFYSDVMQDLLPPSSMDTAKGADSDLPLELYADVGFYMKPKVGMEGKHVKADDIEKLTEDPKMTFGANAEHPPSFQALSHVDNLFPLSQGDSAGGASRRYGKRFLSNKSNLSTKKISERKIGDSAGGASKQYGEQCLSKKSNLDANKNSERENMSPNEKSGIIAPLEKELPRASSFYEPSNENDKASLDQRATITTSGSVDVTGHGIIDESKNAIENATEQMHDIPADGSSSDMVKLIESGMNKEMDMRPSSCGCSLAEENATDVCTDDEVVSLVESCANGEVQRSKISCEEDFVSNSGWLDDRIPDVNEVDTSIEHQLEIIQEVDKAKLDESCIIVDGDEFHFVPHSEGKSKSYKKIRDVFSPRRRSMRKHEYEQLAIWPDSDSNPNQEDHVKNSMPSLSMKDAKRFPTPDFCESEWELL